MAIDPLLGYPGYLLRRASVASMAGLARRLKLLNLRPAEATVLLIIEANGDITQSTIGRMIDIARANMAPLISRLAKRGLISRHAVDGRSHGLRVTGEGTALVRKVKKTVVAHEEALLAKIPAAHRRAFLSALQALWS
jgi:DNA-binding MarR family transcriptional regulator